MVQIKDGIVRLETLGSGGTRSRPWTGSRTTARAWLCAIFLIAASVYARAEKPAACTSQLLMLEVDGITVNLPMLGLTVPQQSWYRKHGDRGKYSGICVYDARIQVALGVANLGGIDPSVPLYAAVWGERVVTEPYTVGGSFGIKRFYVASGRLLVWEPSEQKFLPIAPLHNQNHTILTSAATSLLKDAGDEIKRLGPLLKGSGKAPNLSQLKQIVTT